MFEAGKVAVANQELIRVSERAGTELGGIDLEAAGKNAVRVLVQGYG